METSQRLLELYVPPEGFLLESLVATTYQIDFEFVEEELLAAALGVRSPVSRFRAFRSELERCLEKTDISILYDFGGCDDLARLSPHIDPIPIMDRKLHSKITLLMWIRRERAADQPPDRQMRLIVGSANLTGKGFRENYECVVHVDYGGRNSSPRELLSGAIEMIRQISAGTTSPQLNRQLQSFQNHADALPVGEFRDTDPKRLVLANQVVPAIREVWDDLKNEAPEALTIVSPFWPEGDSAANALADLISQLGSPPRVDLVCRGVLDSSGREWLPEFDADVATKLRPRLSGRLFLRPALPNAGVVQEQQESDDAGDETEDDELALQLVGRKSNVPEAQRSLHAKIILMDGAVGSVLYVGSSNCTRRGLALGGQTNWEAGFVYRLSTKQRRLIQQLLAFAGPASEVLPDQRPVTVTPDPHEISDVPTFLAEVTASGLNVTITFREGKDLPNDLVILMEVPARTPDSSYWLLYQCDPAVAPEVRVIADLEKCRRCDRDLVELPTDESPIQPNVRVEVRWQGLTAKFPVRFDDKAALPRLLMGRKPTEGELIEYFLFGREPDDGDGLDGIPGKNGTVHETDRPIDTRRILAYFIRRFVQAIPGIEAEIERASYSRTALDSALRGPTSPLELAERAFASLSKHTPDEPDKTPMAVGFQITEILAAVLRCQLSTNDAALRECFVPVIARCREIITALAATYPELQENVFRSYQQRFVGDVP